MSSRQHILLIDQHPAAEEPQRPLLQVLHPEQGHLPGELVDAGDAAAQDPSDGLVVCLPRLRRTRPVCGRRGVRERS